ncbi:GNAT family N-acetyltransferase [Bacillus massiliigorillae]|uniref:GNAT family N-acetyltransferase n=1 Tax=Bacillus massiliigorillae TaxID=1243664 RepID=UPI0003A0659B|nr:GNAT family N-acetyltransferase [Bacillus massiliigorillae]
MNDIQLLELIQLQDICESYDNLNLKLNWDLLKTREEDEQFDFLHYEDDVLVGFLGVYKIGLEYEMCGMVHPQYRRKGIFTALWKQALATIDESEPILLNAPAQSKTAKDWLNTIPCSYAFSEHQMHWEKQLLLDNSLVQLRAGNVTDMKAMMELNVIGFGYEFDDEEEYRGEVEDGTVYIIEVEGKTVGKIHIRCEQDQSWIYGFVIYPQYQGNGYGRSALTQLVQLEENNDVYIEVATENENALSLYEKCGFVSYQTQDYYDYQ